MKKGNGDNLDHSSKHVGWGKKGIPVNEHPQPTQGTPKPLVHLHLLYEKPRIHRYFRTFSNTKYRITNKKKHKWWVCVWVEGTGDGYRDYAEETRRNKKLLVISSAKEDTICIKQEQNSRDRQEAQLVRARALGNGTAGSSPT